MELIGSQYSREMKREKYTHKKDKALKKETVFCAECGEDLEMFGISEVDIEKVKARHAHCKEIGKFKSDKCAMLFIADAVEPPSPDEDE